MTMAALNDEYELESRVPNMEALQAHYAELSAPAADLPDAHLDLAYGDGPRQALDVFSVPGNDAAPALLFFHGGYWRAGSKETRRFPAAAWRARGVAWVPVGYRLAPDVTMDDMVADARAAVREECLALGAEAFLLKPFTFEELIRKTRSLLEKTG